MSLSTKSHLAIGASTAALMAILFLILAHVVTTRFADLEQAETRLNVARVENAIEQELASLSSKAGDWSNWNDSYNFARGTNPGFVATNVSSETFEQLEINLILLSDSSGQVLYGGAYDLDANEAAPLPEDLPKDVLSGQLQTEHSAETGALTGLIELPTGTLMIASRPILDTDGLGPSAGTLVFGRYLDPAMVAQLTERTRLAVAARPFHEAAAPKDFAAAARSLVPGSEAYVATLGDGVVAGYSVLDDIRGEPLTLLRVAAPRTIFDQGQAMLGYFGAVLMVFGLLGAVAVGWLLDRLLLSRLERVEAEGRYHAVVSQAAEAILLIDPETGQVEDANQAFFKLFGYGPEEANTLKLIDLERNPRNHNLATRTLALEDNRPSSSARQWFHKDGHGLDVEINVGRIAFGGRGLACLLVRDISARRKAERALRQSEERLRGVFEHTRIGIYQIALDGHLVFANPALAKMLGFETPDELQADGIPPALRSPLPGWGLHLDLQPPGEVHGRVVSWNKPDGSTLRVRVNARPVSNSQGAIQFIEGTVEDITELLDAQEDLGRKARYLLALNRVIAAGGNSTHAPELMAASLDSTLQALGLHTGGVWAGKHQCFVGLPGDLMLAIDSLRSDFDPVIALEDCSTILPGDRLHPVAEFLARSGFRSALAIPLVCDGRRVGGLILAAAQPRDWPEEEAALAVAIAGEIAAGLHRIEMSERAHHQDRLAAVGQLAAGIAHDFNNILAAIILHAEMLAEEHGLTPRGAGRARTILEQGRRASSLVAQVLDFSRRSVLEMEPVDLLKFLREQLKLLERTLPETIRLVLNAEEGEYLLRADLTRLQQVLLNLSTNARDAMPAGGTLTFSLQRSTFRPEDHRPFPELSPGDWLSLCVKDSGIGMPEDVIAHMYEPFFTTKAPGKGTGLGLSQVYGIIKQHEGFIDVASVPGVGTTFSMLLPALPSSQPSTDRQATRPVRGRGETLLLVEDEPAAREAMTDVLEGLGYQVICACNGRQALELFCQHAERIRLVISDMVMPELGGRGLHEQLIPIRPDLKMIFISGYPLGETGQLQLAKGIVRLQKPLTSETLGSAVRRALA